MDSALKKDKYEINNAKIGFVISILTIALNAFFGYVVMRRILGVVGDANYGIYKTASSLCGTVSIFDFGISVVAMRYLSSYYKKEEKKNFENYLSISLIIAAIASALILIFGLVFFICIPTIYKQSFTPEEINRCKIIFSILCLNMVLTIFSNLFCAVISSCRRHYLSSGIKLMGILVKIIACLVFFYFYENILLLACITLGTTILCILIEIALILFKFKVRFRLYNFDKKFFKTSLVFCSALFFQSIAILLNGNIDNIFIGALISPQAVSIYSFSIVLLNTVEQIGALFTPLSFPKIVDFVDEDNNEKLYLTCKRIGRIQVAILSPIVLGFAVFGRQFILLWLGEGYIDVYYLTLILIIPRFFELIINTNINILKAKAKLKYRSYLLIGAMIINLVITIVGIKLFGYFGAASGTAVAIVLGDIIGSSILYFKVSKINVLHLYLNVLSRIWIAVLIPFAIFFGLSFIFGTSSLLFFILGIIGFILVYGIALLVFGFTKEDKKFIFNFKGSMK